ncbi:MAG: hypothetical protein HY369_02735 [Candidatus Aenigmarchaeota archaeon]|nr:hypothetical protein [Candidatus Aenigmarchaeota archaeon]
MRILLAALFSLLLLAPPSLAVTTPDLTFIPAQISASSPFIVIAKGQTTVPTRVTWTVPGFGEADFGSFSKVGDLFVCYFSNADPAALCGPTPFQVATVGFDPATMLVNAVDASGATANKTAEVPVGSMTLITKPNMEIPVNGTIYMSITTPGNFPTGVTYAVLLKNFSFQADYKPLTYDVVGDKWIGNVTLPGGEYYLVFSATSASNFGGTVVSVSVPQDATGAGVCSVSESDYPLLADQVNIPGVLVEKGKPFSKTGYFISNGGSAPVNNITASVPAALANMLEVALQATSLDANDTTSFTVTLKNIDQSLTINTIVTLLSNGTAVGEIPVLAAVTVTGALTCSGEGSLAVAPSTWAGEFSVGPVSKTFTLSNNGNSAASGFNISTSGTIAGIAQITPPPSLPSKGAGSLVVELDPAAAGTYEGTVTVAGAGGSATILVNARFFADVTGDIDAAKQDLEDFENSLSIEQLTQLAGTIDDVSSLLDDAQSSFTTGDYAEAEQSLNEAKASITVLGVVAAAPAPPGTPPSADGSGLAFAIPLIVVVIVVAVVLLFFLRRRKKTAPKDDEDEGLDDDLKEEFES